MFPTIGRLIFCHLITLRYLHEIKSMGYTAKLFRRNQPAVSLQIRELEKIAGFKINFHQWFPILFIDQREKYVRTTFKIKEHLKLSLDELKGSGDAEPNAVSLTAYDGWSEIAKRTRQWGFLIFPSHWQRMLGRLLSKNQMPEHFGSRWR